MKFHMFTKYLQYLTYKQVKPNFFARAILNCRGLIQKKWALIFDYKRFIRINSLPNNPLENFSLQIPDIELLLVTKSKDIELLDLVISSALKNSLNPISLIKIIVPKQDIEFVKQILWSFEEIYPIQFLDEDSVIPESIRRNLKGEFKGLYGWVLQQYLKIWMASNSHAKGVLVIDADTILLSPRLFLDSRGKQILTPSVEYHKPYYNFLNNAQSFFGDMRDSFVSHHMLMQPDLAKAALSFCNNSLDDLTNFVINFYDKSEKNPICLDFEVYAQYVVANASARYALAKWSNLSVNREIIIGSRESIIKYAKCFNSISLHSYL